MSKDITLKKIDAALSFADKMQQGLQSLREQKKALKAQEGVVLLLDVSGSMAERVGEKRKIDHLREAVKPYTSLRMVSFSGRTWEMCIPEPQSNTDLAGAFSYLKASQPKEVILVSDGLPDSPEAGLAEAKALGCPVNVIYIGQGGDTGEAFMRRLAAETGGREITVNEEAPNFGLQLESKVRLMLPQIS